MTYTIAFWLGVLILCLLYLLVFKLLPYIILYRMVTGSLKNLKRILEEEGEEE